MVLFQFLWLKWHFKIMSDLTRQKIWINRLCNIKISLLTTVAIWRLMDLDIFRLVRTGNRAMRNEMISNPPEFCQICGCVSTALFFLSHP